MRTSASLRDRDANRRTSASARSVQNLPRRLPAQDRLYILVVVAERAIAELAGELHPARIAEQARELVLAEEPHDACEVRRRAAAVVEHRPRVEQAHVVSSEELREEGGCRGVRELVRRHRLRKQR